MCSSSTPRSRSWTALVLAAVKVARPELPVLISPLSVKLRPGAGEVDDRVAEERHRGRGRGARRARRKARSGGVARRRPSSRFANRAGRARGRRSATSRSASRARGAEDGGPHPLRGPARRSPRLHRVARASPSCVSSWASRRARRFRLRRRARRHQETSGAVHECPRALCARLARREKPPVTSRPPSSPSF